MPELLSPPASEPTNPPPQPSWWTRTLETLFARSRLVRPDHSWPMRMVLGAYEASASLGLAVMLILSAAATQAVATFVEAAYGTPAAQFGIYQSWWFVLLLCLLALNIFCAASIRYPWKRYQTGFVVTHIGLLVLLTGTAISRLYGVDAQIPIWEGKSEAVAQERTLQFRLWIDESGIAARSSDSAEQAFHIPGLPRRAAAPVTFEPGPFTWQDYGELFAFHRADDYPEEGGVGDVFRALPHQFSRWAMGGVFRASLPRRQVLSTDGVQVEVLDFYADAEVIPVPSVDVRIGMSMGAQGDEETGRVVDAPPTWMPAATLGVHEAVRPEAFPFGIGDTVRRGGGAVVFWMTGHEEQSAAFLANLPEGSVGERGQVVLTVDGKTFRIAIDEKLGRPAFPLTGTDYTAKVEWCNVQKPGPMDEPMVGLRIARLGGGEADVRDLILRADSPHTSQQDHERRIYGDYWYSRGKLSTEQRMSGGAGVRFDILQTHDNRLLYRAWNGDEVRDSGELTQSRTADTAIPAFIMPQAKVLLYVETHRGGQHLDGEPRPLPFSRKQIGERIPWAKVRMTVDGHAEEFWVSTHLDDATTLPRVRHARKIVTNPETGKTAALSMPLLSEPIGFRIRLRNFERRLDPGTRQPSHYSSTVDFLELDRDYRLTTLPVASGLSREVQVPGLSDARSIAVDGPAQRVYWIDAESGNILSASLAAPEEPTIVVNAVRHGVRRAVALAIDSERKLLFWADETAGLIGRASLEAKALEQKVLHSHEELNPKLIRVPRPTHLVLDTAKQMVYWSDSREEAIGRAAYDGHDITPRHLPAERVAGLAIDSQGERLYWSDSLDGEIRSARLDGTDRSLLDIERARPSLAGKQPAVEVAGESLEKIDIMAGEMAFDPAARRLLWIDTQAGLIHQVSLPADAATTPDKLQATLVGDVSPLPRRTLAVASGAGDLYWLEEAALRSNVFITMNNPVDYANPLNGRSYRLFQESFHGPYMPGSETYNRHVPAHADVPELYATVLTVNYDPGRGVTQAGCLLIVAGISIMFYMRAYFFMPGHRAEEAA